MANNRHCFGEISKRKFADMKKVFFSLLPAVTHGQVSR